MKRAYYDAPARQLLRVPANEILGALASHLPFALEPTQRSAWEFEISHAAQLAAALPSAHFFFEFMIPRMGRRADLVLVYRGIVFVIEYKVGAPSHDRHALDQAYGYALDLKHFHETSHNKRIVPIVVATGASASSDVQIHWDEDQLAQSLCASAETLLYVIGTAASKWGHDNIDAEAWARGRYKPTPTIIEAAQALYRGHEVDEISRSEAGAENLHRTAAYISAVIEDSKVRARKAICFVTGVPGSGKTLAGLNIATARMRSHDDEHAVFLSGNGPLVEVLRAALTNDALAQAAALGKRKSRTEEERKAATFIQNIHHFRDEALLSPEPPVGKVVVFDEAQRAWGEAQTSRFMREKRGQPGFSMSEPEFLLSTMDRHPDWCVVVCLIGSGQEINTGEAGLEEWLAALTRSFPHWDVHLSPQAPTTGAGSVQLSSAAALHLATSVRSFRAERVSDFVSAIVDGSAETARQVLGEMKDYPVYLTRDLSEAREWLRDRRRGTERAGLLASSNALRLKPHGVYVKAKVEPALWFLAPTSDVRSSDALEDAATEFEVQGLELDWACVCWDANWRWGQQGWETHAFRGSAWQHVNDAQRRKYIANSYRVLLTRARQGMIIFVPYGDLSDLTRAPTMYDLTYEFLRRCGIKEVSKEPIPRRGLRAPDRSTMPILADIRRHS